MVDLSQTIAAKSDQLNADDLMGGPITIKIQSVKQGSPDQPVAIFYEGCNGKPFFPCKSMRRVLFNVWGKEGISYAGKSMTLYRDPAVKFGGIAVGGIRISHMSGLEKDMPLALQVAKGSKKLFTVKPLRIQQETLKTENATVEDKAAAWVEDQIRLINQTGDISALEKGTSSDAFLTRMKRIESSRPELAEKLKSAISTRLETIQHEETVAPVEEEEWA